uniref:Uncharacterized protein n=1 Tax=Arcella intermedia TaxID=1963864 RepID=A0A6B2LJD1_9EUKA
MPPVRAGLRYPSRHQTAHLHAGLLQGPPGPVHPLRLLLPRRGASRPHRRLRGPALAPPHREPRPAPPGPRLRRLRPPLLPRRPPARLRLRRQEDQSLAGRGRALPAHPGGRGAGPPGRRDQRGLLPGRAQRGLREPRPPAAGVRRGERGPPAGLGGPLRCCVLAGLLPGW